MRILGIDPGLKVTGYGLIEIANKKVSLLEAGVIEPQRQDLIQHKINKIHKNLQSIIEHYRPQVMVLEKLYTHYDRPVIACILGHVRGVICLLCAQNEINLVEYSVKRIRKAIIGQGAATKLQTQSMVAHLLKINKQNLTIDASDALALALGHVNISRYSL